jgi:hypothetical protein
MAAARHLDQGGVSIQIIKKVYGHHIPGGFDGVIEVSGRIGRRATETQQKQTRQA